MLSLLYSAEDDKSGSLSHDKGSGNLITVYHMERESILKEGFQLTWKSLFPNSIERQNVKLALKVLI